MQRQEIERNSQYAEKQRDERKEGRRREEERRVEKNCPEPLANSYQKSPHPPSPPLPFGWIDENEGKSEKK